MSSQGPVQPWLRPLLRCPACGGELADRGGEQVTGLGCLNPECALVYPIRDGIPVLLVSEAESLPS